MHSGKLSLHLDFLMSCGKPEYDSRPSCTPHYWWGDCYPPSGQVGTDRSLPPHALAIRHTTISAIPRILRPTLNSNSRPHGGPWGYSGSISRMSLYGEDLMATCSSSPSSKTHYTARSNVRSIALQHVGRLRS